MNPELLKLLLNTVVPIVATAIRAHHNATGRMPTDAEVQAALQFDADRYIAEGEAFLRAKGATVPGAGK
ncbi:MAG: hypothetical protein ABI634_02655 [Acidobacteriota bacterium]